MKISSSRSSGKAVVGPSSSSAASGTSSRRLFAASVRSRRMRSIARLRAVVTSQAPGFVGMPVARPALGGDRERLLRGLLGEVEVAEEADQRGEHAAPLVAEASARGCATTPRSGAPRSPPPMPRGGDPRGELDRRVEVVGLEDEVAAERLLESRRTARRSSASCRPAPARSSPSRAAAVRCPGVTPGVSLIAL